MSAEILNLPMEQYVADAFDGPPSLSSSLAHRLLTRSPLHAWTSHPRLNPAWTSDDERKFDVGNAAHAVLLESRELFVVDFPDYRTKQAQAIRDEAKAAGKLPVLRDDAAAITQMVTNAAEKIIASPDLKDLGPLLAERTIRWQQETSLGTGGLALDAWCRCRPDWLTVDHAVVLSAKTTRASAEPDAFLRTLLGGGYDMQAAFECAGVKALTGAEPKYVWLVMECDEPYAVSLVGLSPALAEYGAQRMRAALSAWSYCLVEDRWPAYSDRVCYVEPPAWAMAQVMERTHEPVDDGRPLADQLFGDRP